MLLTFFIIAAVSGLLATIFGIEKLFSDSFKTKPWIIAVLLVTATTFTILYESFKEPEAKKAMAENNQFILKGVGDTVGAYTRVYDSTTKQFIYHLIRDSSKGKTTAPQQPKAVPVADSPNMNFTFDNGISIDSFTNDIISIRVSLSSYFAPSILKEATIYSLASESQNENIVKDLNYLGKAPFLTKNLGFDKNFHWEGGIVIPGYNLKKIKTIIILIKGSYTNSNRKNPQPLDKVGAYDLVSKQFGLLLQPYDDSVRIFLKKKGIIK